MATISPSSGYGSPARASSGKDDEHESPLGQIPSVSHWSTANGWIPILIVSQGLVVAIFVTFSVLDTTNRPLSRAAAQLSLFSLVVSLVFGAISNLSTSARQHHGFVSEVVLSIPSLWLIWAIILFIVSILSAFFCRESIDLPNLCSSLAQLPVLRFCVITTAVTAMSCLIFLVARLQRWTPATKRMQESGEAISRLRK